MSASWSEGKLPESEAKNCYVLAKEQWMNQGAERHKKHRWNLNELKRTRGRFVGNIVGQ